MKIKLVALSLVLCLELSAQTSLYTSSGTISGTTSTGTVELVGFGQIIRNPSSGGYSTFRLYNDQNNALRTLEIDYSGSGYSSSLLSEGPNGESAAITTTGAYPLSLGTSNTARLTILPNGSIGIGSTTPGAKLDIKSGGGAHLFLTTSRGFSTSRSWGIATNWYAEGDFSILQSTTNTDIPSVPRVHIDPNGKVGIGTFSPTDQLEIVNGMRKVGINGQIPGVANGGLISLSRPDDGAKTMLIGSTESPADDNVIYSNGGGTELRLVSSGGPYATAGFGFYNNISAQSAFGSARPTPVMKIDGNGNVGIGTTIPTQKLEVNGTIYSREVKVDLQAGTGPDYVFEPDYKLLSLEEIKSYIEKHKHLPEVPSAKEMETNGVNVSEMNMLLLKKIEELTLYMIEQNNKLELQQTLLQLQQKEIEQLKIKK